MQYIITYIASLIVVCYALLGIDFENIIKKGRVVHAQLLYMILSLILASLLTNALLDIFNKLTIS